MATNIETFLSVYLMIFLKTFVNFRDCNNQTHTKTPTLWSIYKSLNTKALHGGEGGGWGRGPSRHCHIYLQLVYSRVPEYFKTVHV